MGDQERIGWALYLQAWVLFLSQGNPAKALALAEQSLALLKELGSIAYMPIPLSLLGQMSLVQGEWTLARTQLEESLAIHQELGNRGDALEPLMYLGRVDVAQGDLAGAHRRYQECLALQQEMDHWDSLPIWLEGVAAMWAGQGIPLKAVKVWGTAEALREAMGAPIPPVDRAAYEQGVAAARAQLGQEAFAAAWQEGRTMTPEQALAAQGSATIPPQIPTVTQLTTTTKTSPTYPAGLTAREVQVLRLVAQGLTDAQVAEQLIISPRTVNWHLTSIYSKLQVSSRSAATRYAIEHKLV